MAADIEQDQLQRATGDRQDAVADSVEECESRRRDIHCRRCWPSFRSSSTTPVKDLGCAEAIEELVGAGLGCAVLPGTAVRGIGERVTIVSRPHSPKLHRKLALVARRDKSLTKGLREAIDGLRRLT